MKATTEEDSTLGILGAVSSCIHCGITKFPKDFVWCLTKTKNGWSCPECKEKYERNQRRSNRTS